MQDLKRAIKRQNGESDSASDSDFIEEPPTKRQRVDKDSVLFSAYRALGYYTSSVPLCVFKSSQDTLIASVVGGHAFYVFNAARLNLVYMSRYIAEEITAIQALGDGTIFTVLKESNRIQAWNKMHRVREYKPERRIVQMLVTAQFVFCLQEAGSMTLFNTKSGAVETNLKLKISAEGMMHPITYLNKLLVWSNTQMCLLNVVEDRVIYEFPTFASSITTVVQSPVIDVVAIGLADGSILLYNLRFDELLL